MFLAVQRCTSCLPAGVSGCLNHTHLLRTQWSVCFMIISTLYTSNVPRLRAEVALMLTVIGRMGSGILPRGCKVSFRFEVKASVAGRWSLRGGLQPAGTLLPQEVQASLPRLRGSGASPAGDGMQWWGMLAPPRGSSGTLPPSPDCGLDSETQTLPCVADQKALRSDSLF